MLSMHLAQLSLGFGCRQVVVRFFVNQRAECQQVIGDQGLKPTAMQ